MFKYDLLICLTDRPVGRYNPFMTEIDLKQRILDCTLRIIGSEGVRGLTTSKIIKCAGISKGGLYHHFKSLDEIILETTGILIEEIMNMVDLDGHESGKAMWQSMGKVYFKQMQEKRELYLAFFSIMEVAYREPNFMGKMYEKYADFLKLWLDALHKYYGLDPLAPKTMSIFAVIDSNMSGFSMMGLADPEGKMFFPAWDVYVEMLDGYLTALGGKK